MADITRKVNWKVTNLKITRDGDEVKASFKVPGGMTDSSSPSRATWIDHELRLDREGVNPVGAYVGGQLGSGGSGHPLTYTAADRFWIGGNGTDATCQKSFDRNRYHPVKNGRYCKKAVWAAFGGNSMAGAGWGAAKQNVGPVAWASHAFGLPRKPTVSWSYDTSTSTATVTVKTDEGDGWNERYDTRYMVTLRKQDGTEKTLTTWTASRATEITRSYDLSTYLSNIGAGKYVTITCRAYARGMAGDNPSKDNAVKSSRSVAYPAAATIGKITCDKKSSGGKIKVSVTAGKSFAATTTLQLQRATNADKDWNGIGDNWADVSGATDNGDCKSLYDAYADANPTAGVYTFYRVKSTRDQYTTYSAAKRADCIYSAKPTVTCSATVGIVSVTPSSGGTQASVVMGWTDSTSNDGWELSYSTNKGVWNSTDSPSTSTGTNEDSSSKSKEYKHTKTLTVTSLTSGETYYCRVRRYRVVDNVTYYSKYSSTFGFTTESAADDRCGIISVEPAKTGTSAVVVVGYSEDTANTGTEVSWSTSSGAWSNSSATLHTATSTTAGVNSSTKWAKQVSITLSSNISQGTTYYVQARRYKTSGSTTTYTPYSKQQKFTTESAADDQAFIVSVTPGTAGKTATVVVGFNEDNENTGTEIQWSADKNAWKSNVQPESMLATWARATWSGGSYAYKQTSYLRNLEPGKTYWIQARRYKVAGGTTTYSKWSPLQSFKTPKATAANDSCGIVSVTKHSDSTGVNVVVGWTEDTANDGTELTWSADKDAWTSNAQPSSLLATWSDKTSQSASWTKTQTISLHGLERGETYYIRARRYLDDDEGTTYSPYAPRVSITLPAERTDEDVRCGLVSVTGGADGTSAVVVVGWSGDHTGCEVTWSEDPDAWESSDGPKSATFDWQDKTCQSSSWSHTSTIYLRDLTEGETCYVKARSYHDGEDGRVWSDYSSDMAVTPISAPSSVTLSAPSAVARGEAIECYWSIASDLEQAEWRMHRSGYPKKSLASGTGSLCHGTVKPSKYEGMDSIDIYVDAGCGGALTSSNVVSVGIADKPSCEVWAADPLTAQPASFTAYSSDEAATLLCALKSDGVTVSAPDGDRDQIAGDTVWTAGLAPTWTATTWGATDLYDALDAAVDDAQDAYDEAEAAAEADPTDDGLALAAANAATALADAQAALAAHPSSGAVYEAEITLPDSLELADGATYTLQVAAVEPVAGLSSESAEAQFAVAWSHQAVAPSVTVTPSTADRSAAIALAAPTGAAQTDVYDVYRMELSGHVQIAEGVEMTGVVRDPYAPFGKDADLHYRVCLRTVDGDFDFADFAYAMDVGGTRFDWNGKHVELPYNVTISETYRKDFEARAHADGGVDGYYGNSVRMTGSIASDIVRVDAAQLQLVRELGEYAGAVLCRTATGLCFQCNADVSELGTAHNSGVVPVSIDLTKTDMTDEFKCNGGS